MAQRPVNLDTRLIAAREAYGLGAAVLFAGAAHLLRLPSWLTALVVVVLLWRFHIARRNAPFPGKWLMGLVAIAGAAGVLLEFRTLLGRDAGVALLVIMLALKFLETRTQRDAVLLGQLGFFLLVTNFLYSQTILTALYMLACAWLLIVMLVAMQFTGPWPGWRQPSRRAALLLLQALPLMLVLFLLFPRIQGPLWGLPHDAHAGLSGLSDNMSPGSLNSLILSDAVAFRAEFRGRIPPAQALYWRGPVLWDYDGKTWTAPRFVLNSGEPESGESEIEYTVTLEPHNKRWLFALEMPATRPPRSLLTRDMQLLSSTPVRSRIRYDMKSRQRITYGADDSESLLQRALQLPEGFNPQTLAHARKLRQQSGDDRQLVDAVLSSFRNENFVYTLSPPLLGEHAVDEFLFGTRRGFCEHYASAFTVLMRAAGIPARVVTGYQGGQINPVGDYVLVRQADAHAWAEIWLQGSGWVRIDPTAAVSPARVERGIASALPSTDTLPLFVRGDIEWLQRVRLTWDSVTYTWNQWVLGYNPERQRQFLSNIGFSDATWQKLAVALFLFAGAAVMIGAMLAFRELRANRRDAVRTAYDRFCRVLARRGLPRHPAEGPLVYAERARRWRPDAATAIDSITGRYIDLRYGARPGAEALREFKHQVRRFNL
jgi:transglutaminase-like putative cysteine protease